MREKRCNKRTIISAERKKPKRNQAIVRKSEKKTALLISSYCSANMPRWVILNEPDIYNYVLFHQKSVFTFLTLSLSVIFGLIKPMSPADLAQKVFIQDCPHI